MSEQQKWEPKEPTQAFLKVLDSLEEILSSCLARIRQVREVLLSAQEAVSRAHAHIRHDMEAAQLNEARRQTQSTINAMRRKLEETIQGKL